MHFNKLLNDELYFGRCKTEKLENTSVGKILLPCCIGDFFVSQLSRTSVPVFSACKKFNATYRSIGGGLYARAGLGNGRHEAAAGLGGVLDGSGSGPMIRGGLFAGATTGAHGVGVTAGIPNVGPNVGPNNGPNSGPNSGPNDGPSNGPNNKPNDGNRKDDMDDGEKPKFGRSNIQVIARSGNKKEKVLQVR